MRILLVEPLLNGAVAQMGERMTGSHEVRGSIPLSSTRSFKGNRKRSPFLMPFPALSASLLFRPLNRPISP